jgi:uncharacterized protein (DUF1330 family)
MVAFDAGQSGPSEDTAMTAYAIAHLQDVTLGPGIATYLQRIDATLAPFEGRFLVHGATPEVVEGPWPGDLVIVAFPDIAKARAWYASPAYQDILPLRTENSRSAAMLVEGVAEGYKATDVLAKLGVA